LLLPVTSMKFGHTTASLLIAKLHASSRQSSLAEAPVLSWSCLARRAGTCRAACHRLAVSIHLPAFNSQPKSCRLVTSWRAVRMRCGRGCRRR
jgi:hypothetical protein